MKSYTQYVLYSCLRERVFTHLFLQKVPEPLYDIHFNRFRIYSPLVKRVVVSREQSPCFELENWTMLLEYAQSQVLLPNLAAIVIDYSTHSVSVPLSTWILTFGSSLLTALDVTRILTPRSASLLFRDAMHMLCGVTSMQLYILYPGSINSIQLLDRPPILSDEDWGPSINGTDHIQSYLRAATSIRKLTTSYFLLHRYLLDLGDLPHLETLGISMDECADLFFADLPEDAFPALRNLSLNDAVLDQVATIWQDLPIVKHLTTVSLEFGWHDPDLFPQLETTTSTICRLLSTTSRHITHLSLDFFATNEDDSGSPVVHKIDKEVFTLLGHLPLQELFIDVACCGDSDSCATLATSFSQIRVLRLPDQSAQCCDLVLFAGNPKLAYLSLQVNLMDTSNLEIADGGQHKPQQGFLTLDIDPFLLDRAKVHSFVMYVQHHHDLFSELTNNRPDRYIFAMWPNTNFSQLACANNHWGDQTAINKRRTEILNNGMQSLRAVARNGSADPENAASLWELSSLW